MGESKSEEVKEKAENKQLVVSHQAKRSIIVKKITTILSNSTEKNHFIVLKKGNMLKKSDKNYTWSDRFTLMNTKDIRYFYNEEDFKKKPDDPLGLIPLRSIFSCTPLNKNVIGNQENAF